MAVLIAACRLQLRFYRRFPDLLVPLLTGPVYSIIFTTIMRHNDRTDLVGAAALAPFYLTLWWFALFSGGWIIRIDRTEGVLDHLVSARGSLSLVVFGRIAATLVPGSFAFGETWFVARYVVRAPITVWHWQILLLSFLLTMLATAATALLMATTFILTRNPATFSNSASFPFYVLGGILVPISFLPAWIQPLSHVVFLSWSADLLRASISPAPVPGAALGLGMIAGLGAVTFVAGAMVLARVVDHLRRTGELGVR